MSSGFWWLNLWKIKISHPSSEKGNPLELIMKGCPQWVSVSPCSCLQTGFWLTSKHAILLKSSVGLSIFLDFSLFFLNLVFSSLSPALHILLNVFYLWTLDLTPPQCNQLMTTVNASTFLHSCWRQNSFHLLRKLCFLTQITWQGNDECVTCAVILVSERLCNRGLMFGLQPLYYPWFRCRNAKRGTIRS